MQPEFQFTKPATSNEDAATLIDYLNGKDWMTAVQIGIALGWSDRRVRRAAADSDLIISFPGSPGYKCISNCTAAEYHRFRAANRSQAREMIARVMRADRQFYGHPAAIV
jgi:hypothetical protein